ncbi:MAG: regulatory protein RecX [Gammaproteobacteria bacterium]|nr:regulatory protein RecX [Gammaproteobacteria bacterium]
MNNTNNIWQIVLRLLARRDYSQQEIKQKLYAKGHEQQEVEKIIDDLVKAGMINNKRFTENYIHWRSGKGYGPKRIYVELQARGIPDETIAEHLNITDNAWFNKAHQLWLKHFKGKQPANFKERIKQLRFLQYRGFTQEQIVNVVKETTSSEEENETRIEYSDSCC